MENNKIRIAITQGDNNGVGYELILKTFAEQEMFELCTPIVYGSPKGTVYQSKLLGLNVQTATIGSAKEAHEGKINLVSCIEEEPKVDFGQPTKESAEVATKALEKAQNDYRQGLFDALVVGPATENTLLKDEKVMPIYLNEQTRIVVLSDSEDATKGITEEDIIAKAKKLLAILKRDFRLSNPRIAILAYNPEANGKEEAEIILPAIDKMASEYLPVYGPYKAEQFFDNGEHLAFDGIIAITQEQRVSASKMLSDNNDIIVTSGLGMPCAILTTDVFTNAGKGVADENELRKAIYHVTDIYRFQKEYDAPLGNPLPKLYHERPDSGEKLRFSIPKKREEE